MPDSLTPETPVRLSMKQLLSLAVFFVANTAVVVLYQDRRHAASEYRIAAVEREQAMLAAALQSHAAKVEKLTDAITALSINIARQERNRP